MSSESKVNVAIIGLGFGAEFIPIYQKHPNANMYGICRRNEDELKKINERLDKQSKEIKKILTGLFVIGFLIIIFS